MDNDPAAAFGALILGSANITVTVVVRGIPYTCEVCGNVSSVVGLVHHLDTTDPETVLDATQGPELAYALSLLKIEDAPASCSACGTHFSSDRLRERVADVLSSDGIAALPVLTQVERSLEEVLLVYAYRDGVHEELSQLLQDHRDGKV